MSGSKRDGIKTVQTLPQAFHVDPDLQIPLADGRILSARLWLPDSATSQPVAAVVEYDPYRHRDASYPRDTLIHPWFAGHGFASIRLQPAGAGESTGRPMDEYVAREQDDCVEALAWIAAQHWCSGKTGLFGMSWGANAALQIAARKPPSLKAIIPVHGTDNRYTDDIHYKGGCLLTAGLAWGSTYRLYSMRPPDPESFGTGWREQWLDRLRNAPDVLETWLSHQSRDDYWRHGSVIENYASIDAATLIVTGWADDYRNAALRLATHLTCPRDLLAGPWGHEYPHLAAMQPRVGFLQIATDWWNRWLGDGNDDKQPDRARIYIEDPAPASTRGTMRPGRWLTLPTAKLPGLPIKQFPMADDATEPVVIRTPLAAAIEADQWLSQGRGIDSTVDQRDLETGAHVFALPIVSEPLEILGQPFVTLTVQTDRASGHVSIRLSSVSPDGDIQQMATGILNLRFSNGFGAPLDMPVGDWVTVTVPLDAVARLVPSGYQLRLSVATQAWPLIWPEPVETTLRIQAGSATLSLPCLPKGVATEPTHPPEEALVPIADPTTQLRNATQERAVTQDPVSGYITRTQEKDHGSFRVEENCIVVHSAESQSFSILGNDALTAKAELTNRVALSRGDWSVRLESEMTVTADATNFHLRETYRAYEADTLVHSENTVKSIPRI